jgi:U3 small nucleolar RNA-associated protein 11
MSSLRNAVKRVTHKERSQPFHRRKLGLLEKHSDYIERANDFKKKNTAIRTLRKKVEERNPDEFYFKMNKSEIKNGKHRELDERNKALDHGTVQLLKTQDLGYIIHKKSVDDRKIEKMKSNLHLIGAVLPRHKIFCESKEEVETFEVAKYFDTLPSLASRAHNRPRIADIEKSVEAEGLSTISTLVTEKKTKLINKNISSGYDELNKRIQRRDKIHKTMDELQLQRNVMNSKGSKRKIKVSGGDGEEKVIYKWKRQRNR